MFIIILHLLHLLILGGCNNILHQYNMVHYNKAQLSSNNNYAFARDIIPVKDKDINKLEELIHVFKNRYRCNSETDSSRNWITEFLIQYTKPKNKENEEVKLKYLMHTFKHKFKKDTDSFSKWIAELLIRYAMLANKESKNDLQFAAPLFRIFMNVILPHDINARVSDTLIDKLLGHLNAARDRYAHAKTCATAIADMAIMMVKNDQDTSSSKWSISCANALLCI